MARGYIQYQHDFMLYAVIVEFRTQVGQRLGAKTRQSKLL